MDIIKKNKCKVMVKISWVGYKLLPHLKATPVHHKKNEKTIDINYFH